MEPAAGSFLLVLAMGLAMSAIALVGGIAVLLSPRTLDRILLPMVGFAAGSLMGGAFFHLVPEAMRRQPDPLRVALAFVGGFTLFLGLEQLLHWHHHRVPRPGGPRPVAYLVLLGDALHNLIGGLAVGAAFTIDPRIGFGAWVAAAAHEVPQELGDFAILMHAGLPRRQALLANLLSALTFPVGALAAWALATRVEVTGLLAFAAGNFVYIAASDLIPEIRSEGTIRRATLHFLCFVAGLVLLYAFVNLGG